MVRGDENFIVLHVENMHEGIAGIVAGKIKDEYQRPVIIVTPSEERGRAEEGAMLLKGTGRSIEGVDIYEVLNRHSDLFIRFGGHSKACGFLMEADHLDRLTESVNREVGQLLIADGSLFEKKHDIDAEITPADVTVDLAKELSSLAPFGEGNPEPLLRMKHVRIRNINYMGTDMTHARFNACAPASESGGRSGRYAYAECVMFRRAQDMKPLLECSDPVEITGSINLQTWKGQERVQFIIEDIKREK
jgi:single-stranded-DNA-specific exonuclease